MADGAIKLKSEFDDVKGEGTGYVSPPYNVDTTPILVSQSDKGMLVQMPVGNIVDRISAGLGIGGVGTGEQKSDAVKFFTPEDFKKDIGTNFVDLKRYERDFKGIEDAIKYTSMPVADDAYVMQQRLQEVGRDLQAYQDNLQKQYEASGGAPAVNATSKP